MSSIIKVTGLSKSYTIAHEGAEKYTTLRDVMSKKVKRLVARSGSSAKSIVTKEEFWALKDVCFNVEQGDRMGIIGRNGAGKSTLLKILSRITEPTQGSVKINGRVAALLEVGTGFHPELTGRENIFLNGGILGMSRSEIKKHFDAIIDFAETEKFLDTPVKRYSSGMYVRLAFSIAAHLEPEILIVDEVLAVGDAQFQQKCLGKMEDVSKNEGRTVLFVSHNMKVIKDICNKGIFLKNGQIHSQGTINNVISDYLSSGVNKDEQNQIYFDLNANKDSQIESASLVKKDGRLIASYIHSEEEVFIKISYRVYKKIHRWHLTFFLRNNLGDVVYVADRTDFHKDYLEADIGSYTFLLKLPVELLLPGVYFVSCYCGNEESGDSFIFQDGLSFEIDNINSYRTEGRAGYFFTPVEWKQIEYQN
ncbi:MAG TPA: ABC transporter ATP-binding protein [Chitinophagaceae bacterium]|nr:ABC transporter ATP-binding protein [Chitinophagaceae bacterium]